MSYRRTLRNFFRLCVKLDGLKPAPALVKARKLVAAYYPNLTA